MKLIRVLFSLFLIITLSVTAYAAELLIPGGQVIGLELQDNTVTVVAFDEALGSAAKAAGLREGDRILRIDETHITCARDIQNALSQCGDTVEISVLRNGKTKTLSLSPVATDQGLRLGVYLRQGTTGVGTVTYYKTDSRDFAALGHGVNSQNGNLLKITAGSVYPAHVAAVKKGAIGAPGQLIGQLTASTPAGSIRKNTPQGIFGQMEPTPKTEPLPVAESSEIRTGKATIRSTVEGTALREYSVEILKVYPNARDKDRNMLLRVTDPDLLAATGGIVQGMSGSPIIQDGKLIGAVTHVLVNDPTTGYGIFIENMLDAAA